MQTAIAVRDTAIAPPLIAAKNRKRSTTPAPRVVHPEPSKQLIDTKAFYWHLYEASSRRGISILKEIRRARQGDSSPSRLFRDALKANKLAAMAGKTLRAKMRTLPDNQKIDRVQVAIGYTGQDALSSGFPSEIIKHFDAWIEQAKIQGNRERVSWLKRQKIAKLEDLASTITSVLDGQKQTGLWDLRVEACGCDNAAWRLTYEACRAKLRTASDCIEAALFLKHLAETINRDIDRHLNVYHTAALASRIASALQSGKRECRHA
jgi:hypothetical protein